ncbi:MAG: nuclear transport factor 2 family protein [Actinomycetota bacterium]
MSQENVEIVRGVRTKLSPLSERVSQRRTLDERLFIRFPALFRLLTDRLMGLPPRSRLRRLMLARLVGRAYAAANRRDFDLVLTGLDPEFEYRPPADLTAPDQDAVFYGHDGYRRLWRTWLDAFEDLRYEPEEVLDLGDMYLATVQMRGHGSGSGVPMGLQLFQLFNWRRGLLVWQQDFGNRAEALEAAGLRE